MKRSKILAPSIGLSNPFWKTNATTETGASLPSRISKAPAAQLNSQQKSSKPRTIVCQPDRTMIDPNYKEKWFDLPGGWRKQIVPRRNGKLAGRYDVYLRPPGKTSGRKLRSNNDLLNWVQSNRRVEIDCTYVNMHVPINKVKNTLRNEISLYNLVILMAAT